MKQWQNIWWTHFIFHIITVYYQVKTNSAYQPTPCITWPASCGYALFGISCYSFDKSKRYHDKRGSKFARKVNTTLSNKPYPDSRIYFLSLSNITVEVASQMVFCLMTNLKMFSLFQLLLLSSQRYITAGKRYEAKYSWLRINMKETQLLPSKLY